MRERPYFSRRLQVVEPLRCQHCGKELVAHLMLYCPEEMLEAGSRAGVHFTCVHEADKGLSVAVAEARGDGHTPPQAH